MPYLVLVATTPHPTVTYVILNWRMHELDGERYCRTQLRQFEAAGLVELHDGLSQDRRENKFGLRPRGTPSCAVCAKCWRSWILWRKRSRAAKGQSPHAQLAVFPVHAARETLAP